MNSGAFYATTVTGQIRRYPKNPANRMQKVLYLDDNRVALKLMERTLEDFLEVIGVSSQAKAFEILASHPVSLILTDYTLEDGNGIEFAKKVRRHERYRHIPIVLLSASLTKDLSYVAMRCGINQSRRKPLSPAELKEVITSQLTVPFFESVERPYFILGCIAWERERVYYQYSPDADQTVSDDSPEGAHEKMGHLLRKQCRDHNGTIEEIIGIEIVYHRLDEDSEG